MPFQNVSADVNDVGFCEGDGDVAVGMRGPVVLEPIDAPLSLSCGCSAKDFARDSALRRAEGNCSPSPPPAALRDRYLRVLSCAMIFAPAALQPFVAVGVIEMPVGVDEVGDGIGAEVGQRLRELRDARRRCRHRSAPCRRAR